MHVKLIKLFRMLILLLSLLKGRQSLLHRRINKAEPMIIISYDDGKISDYDKAYPVHKETGAAAEVCVITGKIGSCNYLTKNQLQELQEAGWEIVSHSRNHNPLNDSFLKRPAFAGDKRICVDHAYRFQKNADCFLGIGDRRERVKVINISEGFLYIEKELLLDHRRHEDFRVSDEQLLEEVSGSRDDLMRMGFKVRNFTYPYNAFSEWAIKVIEEYYVSARAARFVPIGKGSLNKSVNNCFNKYFLYSYPLEDNMVSKKDIIYILDKVRKNGGVCIFHAHTSSPVFSLELLRLVFTEAKKRGIPFVTRSMIS